MLTMQVKSTAVAQWARLLLLLPVTTGQTSQTDFPAAWGLAAVGVSCIRVFGAASSPRARTSPPHTDTGSETCMTYIPEQSLPPREIPAAPVSPAGRSAQWSSRSTPYPGGAIITRAVEINAQHAPTVLRIALAVVFVWFGALKISGASPVRELIGSTLPFINPNISVPVLGAVELVIGLTLLIGRFPRITLLSLAGHLIGTFLTFITASELMLRHGSPWQLTSDGEFVVKNLVLISAALLLIGCYSKGTSGSRGD